MPIKFSNPDGQEMLLYPAQGKRGPWWVTGQYPFQVTEDLDASTQGDHETMLADVLGRLEACARSGATVSWIEDEAIAKDDRPWTYKSETAETAT